MPNVSQSGICHDCCKCLSSLRVRLHKQDTQPEACVRIRTNPIVAAFLRPFQISVEGVPEEIQVENESPSSHSRDHVFNVLSLF